MQPQAAAPSVQSQLPAPMQPTLPTPLQPQQAAAAPAGPPQALASPKPPPRSRSSHALPPDAAKPETAPAAQVGANFLFPELLEFQVNTDIIIYWDVSAYMQLNHVLALSFRLSLKMFSDRLV